MRYFIILLFSFLTACGSALPSVKTYKMEIQQGNIVTSKMLLQLRPGMSKSQVRFIMGTPLVVDGFHQNRWDYFYHLRQNGKVIEQRRVILDFDQEGKLAKVRGDVVPQGTPGAVSGERVYSKTVVPEKQTSLMDKLKFWKKDEQPANASQAAKPEEKGWLDSLKFWKSDEKPAATKAEESASKEAAKPAESAADESKPAERSVLEVGADALGQAPANAETPSVLAVPTPTESAGEAPVLPSVPAQEPAPAAPAAEPPASVSPAVQPETPPPAPVAEPPKPEPVVVAPAEPVQEVPVPSAPVGGKQEDKLIFRMDRTLDQKRLEQELAPKPAPKVEQPKELPKKKVDEPLPEEGEPGYFERMLEKIGF